MLNFDVLGKFNAGIRILLPLAEEVDIRDDAENVVLVFPVVFPRLLIRCAEKDLWARAHPEEFVGKIYSLRDQPQ